MLETSMEALGRIEDGVIYEKGECFGDKVLHNGEEHNGEELEDVGHIQMFVEV